MSEDFNYWIIIQNIQKKLPNVIYLSIGSANNQNQQYPPFMTTQFKDENTSIILIDPFLEDDLAINKSIPLNCNLYLHDMRRFERGNNEVFALKKYFYFDNNSDAGFLSKLIEYTLETKRRKLIVQDFTGRNIVKYFIRNCYSYNTAFNDSSYNFNKREAFLNQIIFDVSHGEAICDCDFSKYPIYLNPAFREHHTIKNFVQPAFFPLTKLKEFARDRNINLYVFKKTFTDRLTYINYNLARKIRILKGEIDDTGEEDSWDEIYRYICFIYQGLTFSSTPTIEQLQDAIMIIMLDICEASDIETSLINEIVKNNYNQGHMSNILSPVKALMNNLN